MQSDGCNALNGNTTKLIKEEVGSIDYSMLSTLFFFCDTVRTFLLEPNSSETNRSDDGVTCDDVSKKKIK